MIVTFWHLKYKQSKTWQAKAQSKTGQKLWIKELEEEVTEDEIFSQTNIPFSLLQLIV